MLPKKIMHMAYKHMKWCPISSVTRKSKLKQWKTTIHILNGQNLEHWQCQMPTRMRSNSNSYSLLVEVENSTALWKTVWESVTKKWWSSLVFTQRSWKLTSTQNTDCNTSLQTAIEALVVIKQPKGTSAGEWINKLWYM